VHRGAEVLVVQPLDRAEFGLRQRWQAGRLGVLPGLGGANGVAILLPLTFSMSPTSAIIMLSCIYWGALFGGAITSILGDYQRIGIALFFILMFVVIVFYVIERYWLSERVEDANPETIQKIEEKLLAVEEALTRLAAKTPRGAEGHRSWSLAILVSITLANPSTSSAE
jgi:uncharacterized membrane protein